MSHTFDDFRLDFTKSKKTNFNSNNLYFSLLTWKYLIPSSELEGYKECYLISVPQINYFLSFPESTNIYAIGFRPNIRQAPDAGRFSVWWVNLRSLPHWRVNVCTEIFTYHKIFIIKNYIERIDCVLLLFTGSLLMSSAVCLCQECVAHTQGRGPHGAFRHTPWTLKSTLLFMEKCRSMNRDFEVHSSAPHKQKLQMEMQQLKLDKGW